MNFKQLETFITIVRTGSFNAAAARLNATQSTLSARIQELEQSLGTPLFDRSGRRALLTAKGRELVGYAEQILQLSADIRLRVGDPQAFSGNVRLGVAEIVAVTWLPKMVSAVRSKYPHLTIQVEVWLNPDLLAKLEKGELDAAIVAGAGAEIPFESHYVGSVEFAWMASRTLKLPRKPLSPRDLMQMPLIYQGAESATRRLMSRWLGGELGQAPHSICNSMAGIASLTAAGVGIGFLPLAYHMDRIRAGTLQKLETSPAPPRLPFSIAFSARQHGGVLHMLAEHAVRESTFEFDRTIELQNGRSSAATGRRRPRR